MLKSRPRKTTTANRTAKLPAARRTAAPATPVGCQVCIGRLVGWDDRGPLVDFEGNPRGPVHARQVGRSIRRENPAALGALQHEVVLLVDPRPNRPVMLLGLLQPIGATPGLENIEAHVDGQRVEIDGRDEIVLRCGEASITLRRNGRILISGVQVETRAKGVNRIKGGSVAIN
jgi:Domain of unknown function (DUF6484)